MNKNIIKAISLVSTLLTVALIGNVANAETFEFAGNKYTLQDNQPSQRTITDQFEFAGNKYVITTAKRGQHGSDLAALELQESDNDLIYSDDDMAIVLTGAR